MKEHYFLPFFSPPRKKMMNAQIKQASLLQCYLLMLAVAFPSKAMATEKSGIGMGFVVMQKVWRGLNETPKMTSCRLASRRTISKKQICVYKGSNNTVVPIYNDAGAFCANNLNCKYEPNSSKRVSDYVKAFIVSQKRSK